MTFVVPKVNAVTPIQNANGTIEYPTPNVVTTTLAELAQLVDTSSKRLLLQSNASSRFGCVVTFELKYVVVVVPLFFVRVLFVVND